MLYLKVLMIWFHKILKLIFQKQPSCPRNLCTKHWRKLPNLAAFLEIFTCVKSFVNCAIHYSANFWDFWVLGSKFFKFLMSVLKRQVSSSSNFLSFFSVITHTCYVNFKLVHFLIWIKGSHQSSNFDIEGFGENLPNSLRHFLNHKSVFLEVLHHSSVSWKITQKKS